jgi:hypothetical protein
LTRKETPSTAVARPYLLVRLSTSIIVLASPCSLIFGQPPLSDESAPSFSEGGTLESLPGLE